MNPLDLAVDHVFWELKQNPWVVKDLLNNYLQHYSYRDQLKVPVLTNATDAKAEGTPYAHELVPGGISFCHDMGAFNNFTPCGHSSYEMADANGRYSYSTQEQLCNWILIAASYVARTGDLPWVLQNRETIEACMRSMLQREGASERFAGATAAARNMVTAAATTAKSGSGIAKSSPDDSGVWQKPDNNTPKFFESARCGDSGAEITTYDSLDASLARTRRQCLPVCEARRRVPGPGVFIQPPCGYRFGRSSRARGAPGVGSDRALR